MTDALFSVPQPLNEPIWAYTPGSPEKIALKAALSTAKNTVQEIPMYINGDRVFTTQQMPVRPPHEIKHVLGYYAKGDASHVEQAIQAALAAKPAWETMPWQERAAIFLRAADLLTGPYRARMSAATMLCQSKNVFQAEIDCICELADFWRYNVYFMQEIYKQQPISVKNTWNRTDWRPLEGFVFALTPFNFTAIAGNLPSAPAMLGNVVVWKPSESQILSASLIMEILLEAGLPAGVINLVYVDGPTVGEAVFKHPDFAGLHFTGSTGVFQRLWKTIAENLPKYRTYPRIVGETGGKDFVMVHASADPKAVAVGLARGAFEYQGQKCSAASRAYVPESLWPEVEAFLKADLADMKMGSVENFQNFINAVIDEKAFDKISAYISEALQSSEVELVAGGKFDKTEGYFIEPTVLKVSNPMYVTMCEELFGPVLTVYVYPDSEYESTLGLLDRTSPYALTGAIFSRDRAAINLAHEKLRHAAGNFYINDKPTGAVVGQQPFGGARASGTNDKAGSILNMYR
ncbi:MAG: L-glutamate gamma-semialdehyde dehydrogenase, partial [Bacteroidetes bacterium]|nr:L-glutamate gamma-semialdehyde dehydrogenase [Bacteroidota bacterium]